VEKVLPRGGVAEIERRILDNHPRQGENVTGRIAYPIPLHLVLLSPFDGEGRPDPRGALGHFYSAGPAQHALKTKRKDRKSQRGQVADGSPDAELAGDKRT